MSREVATGRLMNNRDGFMPASRWMGARLGCGWLRRRRRRRLAGWRRLAGRRLVLVPRLPMVVLSVAVAARATALPLPAPMSSGAVRRRRARGSRRGIRNAHLRAVAQAVGAVG